MRRMTVESIERGKAEKGREEMGLEGERERGRKRDVNEEITGRSDVNEDGANRRI